MQWISPSLIVSYSGAAQQSRVADVLVSCALDVYCNNQRFRNEIIEMYFPKAMKWFKASYLIVCTNLSTRAFKLGERSGSLFDWMPLFFRNCLNSAENFVSRSWIRQVGFSFRSATWFTNAFACFVTQAESGLRVDGVTKTSRVSKCMNTNTYKLTIPRGVTARLVKKLQAQSVFA